MVDLQKIEALAKAATQGEWEKDGSQVCPVADQNAALATFHRDADARFVAAANPAAVLEMIAELKCPMRLARHSKRLVEELRAECEALRKDADRYRFASKNLVDLGSWSDEHIDAAMSKESAQ